MTEADRIVEELRYLNRYTGLEVVLNVANNAADYIEKLEKEFFIFKSLIEGKEDKNG